MMPMFNLMAQTLMKNNPYFQRAVEMSKGKSEQEIMQTAQNLCKNRGIDINEAFNVFKMEMEKLGTGMNRQ